MKNRNNKVSPVSPVSLDSLYPMRSRWHKSHALSPYLDSSDTSDTNDTNKKTKRNLVSLKPTLNNTSNTELKLQEKVLALLSRELPPAAAHWHTPNGGSRHHVEAMRLKAQGVMPGVPDLFVLHEGRLVGLELKRPAATLKSGAASQAKPVVSESQVWMMRRLERAGARCFVCRSLDDVRAALTECGIPLERRKDF